MKKVASNLLFKILVAMVVGIVGGLYLPVSVIRVFVTFNSIFGNFLSFVVPLIIIGLIVPGLVELGKSSGKWLVITTGLAYVSTIFTGLTTFLICYFAYPHMLEVSNKLSSLTNPEDALLQPYFTISMPPLFDVMSALLVSFIVGIGVSYVNGRVLKHGFNEFRDVIMGIISKVIIPALPIYICGIFMNMTAGGEVASVISVTFKVIALILVLEVLLLLLQYSIAGAIAGKNPLKCLKNMLPAYFTALGTSSSAATIPVTIRQVRKNGVSESVTSFVVPLCATIHIAGSMMKITAFALAISYISGWELNVHQFIAFIFTLAVTMIAAPGVPGGAIVAAMGILQSMLGFTEPMVAFMIATYIAIDSFGTATNVTGDGAIALIVDRLSRKDREKMALAQDTQDDELPEEVEEKVASS